MRSGRITASAALTAAALATLIEALPATPSAARPYIPPTTITVTDASAPVHKRVAIVRLSCSKGEAIRLTCRGTLTLRARLGRSQRTLGATRFAIQNCCAAPAHAVRVRLYAAALRLLARHRTLRARATARLDGNEASTARSVVLRG